MRSAMGFSVRGENTETLEIDIYDVVGGGWLFGGVTADDVRRQLKANKSAKTIKLRINSEGGDVFEGFAIYNLLNEHPARVEVQIDALAASIASVIAMAADEIHIASNAWVMIHNAAGTIRGAEADELRTLADVIEKMSGQAADIYAARTGKSREEILAMMAAETWMSAADAKAHGFVDTVVPLKKQAKSSAKASAQVFASMSLDSYANVPEGLRELVASARAERERTSSPAPGGPEETPATGEETRMSEDTLKAFLSAQGIDSAASLTARLGIIARLEQLTGKTGEEAVGVLQAWKQSHDELPTVNAKLTKIEQDSQETALAAALQKAKDEARHTPARETKLRELLAAKDLSHAGALAMVAEWGVVTAIKNGRDGAQAQGATTAATASGAELKHNGKTFDEMTGPERAALKRENPDLYKQMRDGSQR